MTSIRKLLGLFLAVVAGVITLSAGTAFAGDKQYLLQVSPTTGTSPVATMTAKFSNTGNSSFNPFTLQVPSNYGFAVVPTISTSKGSVSYTGGTVVGGISFGGLITVTNIGLPVGAGTGEAITVTMTNVYTTGTCGTGTSGNWLNKVTVYAGSSLTGSKFTLDPTETAAMYTTNIAPNCATLTYSANGGAGTVPTAVTAAPGTVITLASGAGLTKSTFIFNGWNSNAAGTGTHYAAGGSFTMPASSVTLYAEWKATYNVTYSGNSQTSGTPPTDSAAYTAGTLVTVLGNTGSLVKTGYTFGGWATMADGSGTSYAAGATFPMPATNVTLYAKWTINIYTVSFNSNGGSAVASQNVQYNGHAAAPAAPTKTNSTFGGWYTDNTTFVNAFAFATTAITDNITLFAKWSDNKLTVASPPSSAAVGTPFDVTVDATNGPVSVNVAAGCDATVTPTPPISSPATFTITINSLPASGECTINFTAPNYQTYTISNLKVYKGQLFCGDYDSINGPSDKSYDPDLASSIAGLGSSYVGPPGWGLRRGPNKDGAACVKVNYSCDMTADATTNVVTCSWDKNVVPPQQATFKYLFLWAPRAPDANGWTSYRPQVSWPPAVPDSTFAFPNWAPLVSCVSDIFSTPPTWILPLIPNAAPFNTDANNTLPQYQPNQVAYVCGAQQGWTAVGAPGTAPGNGVVSIQIWNIVIDEADLKVSGP